MCQPYVRINVHAGGAAIGVPRVVRVQIARRVDVPDVVRVRAIGRAAETVLRISAYSPYLSLQCVEILNLCCFPFLDSSHGIIHKPIPEYDFLCPDMQKLLRKPQICFQPHAVFDRFSFQFYPDFRFVYDAVVVIFVRGAAQMVDHSRFVFDPVLDIRTFVELRIRYDCACMAVHIQNYVERCKSVF
jgi:hypothetical protein